MVSVLPKLAFVPFGHWMEIKTDGENEGSRIMSGITLCSVSRRVSVSTRDIMPSKLILDFVLNVNVTDDEVGVLET